MSDQQSSALNGLSILVVEDEIVFRHHLTVFLSQQGADVYGVENGQLAVDYCQTHTPDVVVMDIVMPKLDGIGLLESIGSGPWAIIVISGKGKFKHLQQALTLGACDYLIKPIVHFEHLVDTILNNLSMLSDVKEQQENAEFKGHVDLLRTNDIESTRLMGQLTPEKTIIMDHFFLLYRMQGSSLLPLYRQMDDGSMIVALADFSGVGPDMSIAAVIIHSVLNELWDKAAAKQDLKAFSSGDVMGHLNAVIQSAELCGAVGLIYGVVQQNRLDYVNAGVLGLSAPFEAHHAGLSLGLLDDVVYQVNRVDVDDSGINLNLKNFIGDRISLKILPLAKTIEAETNPVSIWK